MYMYLCVCVHACVYSLFINKDLHVCIYVYIHIIYRHFFFQLANKKLNKVKIPKICHKSSKNIKKSKKHSKNDPNND